MPLSSVSTQKAAKLPPMAVTPHTPARNRESLSRRLAFAGVREAIAQADRGEFIEEEEMDARLEQMLRS
jgi:hypothetical protein